MLGDLIGGFVGALFGRSFGDRVHENDARRLAQQSRIECAVRVLDGTQQGLSSRWSRGTADLRPRRILIRGSSIDVQSYDLNSVRRPTAKESWSINPRMKLVRITTATAELEWAVPDGRLEWAASVVFSQPPGPI